MPSVFSLVGKRKKSSKISRWYSGGIPGPVSETLIFTEFGVVKSWTAADAPERSRASQLSAVPYIIWFGMKPNRTSGRRELGCILQQIRYDSFHFWRVERRIPGTFSLARKYRASPFS